MTTRSQKRKAVEELVSTEIETPIPESSQNLNPVAGTNNSPRVLTKNLEEIKSSLRKEIMSDLTKILAENQKAYGISLQDSPKYSPLCGRGTRYTSAKLTRTRKQPVLITREIPHCPRPWSRGYRGALSPPAPGRDFSCCGGIPKFARGRGHGRTTQH